jgi:para-nitrobenzyl esterase
MWANVVMRSALVAILMVAPASAEPFGTKVTIESGMIEGAVSNNILSFKGIPYASKPVGALRWQPPQRVTWTGVRSAKEFGPDCLQMVMVFPPVHVPHGAEDCLFLNVWRPSEASRTNERLPVLVWIHGGGNVVGGTSDKLSDGKLYNGRELARQGLVVVTLNYRLGRLGYFAHPALVAASGGPANYSGNFGLMDQIRALEWVKTNIAKFGGDPGQVTIVGESAGGVSVTHLLTSPKAKGLFHRAIVMSGAGRRAPLLRRMTGGTPDRPSADIIGEEFGRSHGIHGAGPDAVRALRDIGALTLVHDLTFYALIAKVWADDPHSGMAMIDNQIITGEPGEVLCRGEAAKVPVIVGTVALELPVYFPPKIDPYPYAYFGADADKARKIYGQNGIVAFPFVGMDMSMHEPARFIARSMTAAGNKAWLYRFTYVAEVEDQHVKEYGAAHAAELPFLFQTLEAKYCKNATNCRVTAKDRQMSQKFSSYFANFAKSRVADPNAGILPQWSKFDPANFQLMNFIDPDPAMGPEPRDGVALVERVARMANPCKG